MKKFLLGLAAILFAVQARAAEVYKLDPHHTNINWSVSHFGFSSPNGKFAEADGKLMLDEKNPKNSSIEVVIKTKSIVTGYEKFDNHLKSDDFFNVDKFPTAKFVSTSVVTSGKNFAKVKGEFTMLGVTKPMTLDVKLNKIDISPITKKRTAGFSATTTIKRSDFGMNYGIPGVGDNVKITIEAEAMSESENAPEKSETKSTNQKNESEWKIVEKDSKLEFKTSQDGKAVTGSFAKFSGSINFAPDKLKTSKVVIDVDTSSVASSYSQASDTLKTAEWLATKAFPKATFTAEKFVAIGKNSYSANGQLTIKGKSQPVVLEFAFSEYKKAFAKAVGSTKIKRSAFGVGNADPNKANGVADEVEIHFVVVAKK